MKRKFVVLNLGSGWRRVASLHSTVQVCVRERRSEADVLLEENNERTLLDRFHTCDVATKSRACANGRQLCSISGDDGQ